MEKNLCMLLLISLLGTTSRQLLATHAAEIIVTEKPAAEAAKVEGQNSKKTQDAEKTTPTLLEPSASRGKEDANKGQKRNPFPVGHRIEVQVHQGVYVVERAAASPEVLTISLQHPDGRLQQFGFVPMDEVRAMLEEAESIGSGLAQALLDAKFLSYAFEQDEAVVEITKPDIMTTTRLAQHFIEAEAQAEEQGRIGGKEQGEDDDEEGDEEEDEEGDEDDGEEEEEEQEEGEKDNTAAEGSLRGSRN